MDHIVEPGDPTLGEAMTALSAMESTGSDAAAVSANEGADARAQGDTEVQTSGKAAGGDDAPAAADQKAEERKSEVGDPNSTKAKDDKIDKPKQGIENGKSGYAKDRERLSGSWKDLNEEKSTFRAQRTQEEQALARRKSELDQREARLAQAQQPKFKPADYENHANALLVKKAELEETARKLEDAGRLGDAEARRDEARELGWKAKAAKESAQWLRENPPKPDPTAAERTADLQRREKEWYAKANQDFPDVGRQGTPANTKLQELIKEVPSILEVPEQMYFACRLANAESAAAGASKLKTDLDAANAKIKELEQKLAVPAEGSVNGANRGSVPFEQRSYDEQLATMESEARAMSRIV